MKPYGMALAALSVVVGLPMLAAPQQAPVWHGAETSSTTASAGDANGDGIVSPADIFYLINFMFANGPGPVSLSGGSPFTWQGAWSSTTTYNANDVVSLNGSSYISLAASNLGNRPDLTATKWQLMAAAGAPGAAGPPGSTGATGPTGPAGPAGLTWRGGWSSTVPYSVDDAVSFNGSSYVALAANTGAQPDQSASTWNLLASVASFAGTAAGGDLGGTYPNPTVAAVGGQTAATVASGAVAANAATNANTANAIVRRDGSGNFSAGTITAALNGNAATATSATNFSGVLGGEVTGNQASTVVSNAVSTSTAGAIVRRDSSANFSAGSVTLSGVLSLPSTSATPTGMVELNGTRFLHAFGTSNTFVGAGAGNLTLTTASATQNTAVGAAALGADTTGNLNTAVGAGALAAITASGHATAVGASALTANTAIGNTGVGALALMQNTTGTNNVALGESALRNNIQGNSNTALGFYSLLQSTGSSNIGIGDGAFDNLVSGSGNVGIGVSAGNALSVGDNNIMISNAGVVGDSGVIRIGSGSQTRAFIAGINGATTSLAGVPVYVDSNGQLGTNGGAAPTSSNTPSTIVQRDGSGNFSAGTISAALNGNAATATMATNFSGSLSGEVTGGQSSTVVTNAVSANTVNAIVRRDSNGDFSAHSVTLTGDLTMPTTTSSTGRIFLGTSRFLHAYGAANTFVGQNAGNFTLGVAFQNTGVGTDAGTALTTGSGNTLFGYNAGLTITSGSGNIFIGSSAGSNITTTSNNIDIGTSGTAGDSGVIRIGGGHSKAFIAGISGVTTGGTGTAVVIDSNGQLGTISSSRRYKFDIDDMGDRTDALMRLRPVTFRYLSQRPNADLQYGLVAEEAAEVYPELVMRNKEGEVETVLYQFLAPMLLNEVQKQHRTIEEQQRTIEAQQTAIEALTQRLSRIERALALGN